ncbi:unnamed protein product [Paramecium pentaurelia]|uniref:Uncharacterized protein n=1 Tax=Paramecium pentaurelia TaxID=43138 RepID=A0A8S1Y658_9CILI|nr:unnamed protein product [Paramecium pentaurelia]
MKINIILNLIKLKKERRQIQKILDSIHPEEQNFACNKQEEILYYNIYILTILPILRILEIVKHTLIEKFITKIPAFHPFTKQQVEEESLHIFNDFLDSLSQKGQMNVNKYIHNIIKKQITYKEVLKLATTAKTHLMQPNDFQRQSSIQLKHINGNVKVKSKMSDFYENTADDHLQRNLIENKTFDFLYIFIGDIHYHKLLEDPDYLYNQIQHMNPDYWKTKYTPLMHKISECIDEDLEVYIKQDDKNQNKQEQQQQKQEYCCILRAICQYAVDLLKSINVATLYYYSVNYSFQKFVNRLNGNEDLQRILYLTQNHYKERNYKQHIKDYLRGYSNFIREIRNKSLVDKGERELIKIILNF